MWKIVTSSKFIRIDKTTFLPIRFIFLDLLGPWEESMIWQTLRIALFMPKSFLQIHFKRPMIQKTFLGLYMVENTGRTLQKNVPLNLFRLSSVWGLLVQSLSLFASLFFLYFLYPNRILWKDHFMGIKIKKRMYPHEHRKQLSFLLNTIRQILCRFGDNLRCSLEISPYCVLGTVLCSITYNVVIFITVLWVNQVNNENFIDEGGKAQKVTWLGPQSWWQG